MPRKLRSDSVGTEVEMARAKEPLPPAHIDIPVSAIPAWRAIVRAREYKSWTDVDLEHAANLAVCLDDLERLRREVRIEGDIIENLRGTKIVNPKHSLLETLSRRSVALSRLLHVHAQATVGDSDEQSKRNNKQRKLKEALAQDDDSLIAPSVH